jgi:hypothetical protein
LHRIYKLFIMNKTMFVFYILHRGGHNRRSKSIMDINPTGLLSINTILTSLLINCIGRGAFRTSCSNMPKDSAMLAEILGDSHTQQVVPK